MMPTKVIAHLLVSASRHKAVRAWLHQLGASYKQTHLQIAAEPGFEIPEVTPIAPRIANHAPAPRLNLLIPAVSQQHVFGGIATALQVFDAMRWHFATARILLTDESSPKPNPQAFYGTWPVVPMAQERPDENQLVALGDRWNQSLSLHAQDYFMATAWWTAHNARSLLNWQQQQFSLSDARNLLYLIQDYEPGFYPWSSRYVLAQATYNHPEHTIAVVNSSWLADYLAMQGHYFKYQHILEPRLHPALAIARANAPSFIKARQLLVYGRPSTDRNAFSVIVAALRLWVQRYPEATNWQIISAGEPFTSVKLGDGCELRSVGKVSIEEYAEILSKTAVGLSLMVSPHPSYPPLEMAAFGARVVTNQFANKNLSGVSSHLISVEHPDPDKLADALLILTAQFDAMDVASRTLKASAIDWSGHFLQPDANASVWQAQIAMGLTDPTFG